MTESLSRASPQSPRIAPVGTKVHILCAAGGRRPTCQSTRTPRLGVACVETFEAGRFIVCSATQTGAAPTERAYKNKENRPLAHPSSIAWERLVAVQRTMGPRLSRRARQMGLPSVIFPSLSIPPLLISNIRAASLTPDTAR